MSASLARSRRQKPLQVTVRPGRKRDLERLLEIHGAAFPDPRPVVARRHVFLSNRLGGFQHLRVAECGGDLVAHAFLFPLEVWVGGMRAPAAAVASVGVAVEARGSGVGTALLERLHEEMETSGAVFSVLYPFRQGFYAGLGYAPVSRQRVVTLSPRAIPDEWTHAAAGVVRRMVGRDVRDVASVYEDAGRLGNGFIVRTKQAWESHLLDEKRQWLVLDDRRTLRGYVSFTLQQSEAHARIRAEIHELVAPAPAARRRLLAAIAGLRDQVGDVTLKLADDDITDWGFVDPDRDRPGTVDIEHSLGVVTSGPMVRFIGPASAAAKARGYGASGKLNVAVDLEAPFELTTRGEGKQASIGPARKGPTLNVTRKALASIALGGLGVEGAARLGWLPGNEESTLRHAAALLHTPAFFTLDAF